MISAREAFNSIERALQGLRKDEDRLVAMLTSCQAEADRLRAEQAEGFRALARLRLDALAREEAVGRLDSAERRAMEALSSRRDALKAAAARRSELTASIDAIDQRREAAALARDTAVKAVEDLSREVEQSVASTDPAWRAADAAAREASRMADAAEEKSKQAAEDRDQKRKPYEADPLFMYLWSRGFGTAAYRAGPIARFFDRKVARLVGYETARVNFFMLNEIPIRLEQHAIRLREQAAASLEERQEVERAALERAGIGDLEAAAEAREAELADAEADLASVRAALARLDEESQGLLEEGGDPRIRSAVDDLAAAMARDDLRKLYRAALDTPTPEDETIVKRLQEAERQLVRVGAQMEEVRAAAVDLARKKAELERSEQNFRKSGYDNPLGEFVNGAVIGAIIQGIIRGAMSSSNLDEVLGKEYRRRGPSKGGSFGGGIRLPGNRGGFSTGGSIGGKRGGGGFRTGGKF
jgi:chromosome segregation ATPase